MMDDPTDTLPSFTLAVYHENGRTYHGYHGGKYPLPNDQIEQERLNFLHSAVYKKLNAAHPLYRAPITQGGSPARILDLGTGTGEWAIDMAAEFDNATVVGTDLSPIQPTWVPPNCHFEVDDFEMNWVYRPDEKFDFIHCRDLSGSVQDYPWLLQQAMQNMTTNGYLEIQDQEIWIYSDCSVENMEWIMAWQDLLHRASVKFQKPLRTAEQLKNWMETAGFVDVHHEIQKVSGFISWSVALYSLSSET
jgi:trans-aconitate methyltransferase